MYVLIAAMLIANGEVQPNQVIGEYPNLIKCSEDSVKIKSDLGDQGIHIVTWCTLKSEMHKGYE